MWPSIWQTKFPSSTSAILAISALREIIRPWQTYLSRVFPLKQHIFATGNFPSENAKANSNATINTNFMPDFEQRIQHCYHNQSFVTKDMRKKNFHRRCLERINLSWFVTTLSSAKTKHLPGILNCRHFDPACFSGNIMAPIPSRAEITQATLSMRSHFAAVSASGS